MARVVLPGEMAGRFGLAATEFDLDAASMRELYRALEARYPGLGTELSDRMFAILDGEIVQDALFEPLEPGTEVAFMPKIRGG